MSGSQTNPYGTSPQGSQPPHTAQFDTQVSTPAQPKKKKRGFLKWGLGVVAVVALFNVFTNNNDDDADDVTAATADSAESVDFIADTNTNADTDTATKAGAETPAASDDDNVSTEFKNALRSAERYLDFSSFSYQGLFDQLTSEYGEGYPEDAAQYALDNVTVDWNQEALESAENYLDFSHFSYAGLYDQLTSEHGEQFTADQAQYAVDNVDADWNAEAVEAAESYQKMMPMSGSE